MFFAATQSPAFGDEVAWCVIPPESRLWMPNVDKFGNAALLITQTTNDVTQIQNVFQTVLP